MIYISDIFASGFIRWKHNFPNGADSSNKMKIWTLNLYKSGAMSVYNYYLTFGKTAVKAATKCEPRWDPLSKDKNGSAHGKYWQNFSPCLSQF